MGLVPADEPDMAANAVLRDTPKRVIRGVDSQLGPFAMPFGAMLHQKVEPV
jgi:hypothetical protein